MRATTSALTRDLIVIALSVLVAVIIVLSGVLSQILSVTRDIAFLNSFIAGFFFTSIFTTAPAMVVLGEISRLDNLYSVAFFGALGAMCGDYLIFTFARNVFSVHLTELITIKGLTRKLHTIFKLRLFRWLTFLVGGLIIASPLPDELGLGLLGFSKAKTPLFLVLSFAFNFLGIVLVGLVARAV
ncbi:MAG: hypothetical protein WCT02_01275 [Candidatus Paceibacterota bacterium]